MASRAQSLHEAVEGAVTEGLRGDFDTFLSVYDFLRDAENGKEYVDADLSQDLQDRLTATLVAAVKAGRNVDDQHRSLICLAALARLHPSHSASHDIDSRNIAVPSKAAAFFIGADAHKVMTLAVVQACFSCKAATGNDPTKTTSTLASLHAVVDILQRVPAATRAEWLASQGGKTAALRVRKVLGEMGGRVTGGGAGRADSDAHVRLRMWSILALLSADSARFDHVAFAEQIDALLLLCRPTAWTTHAWELLMLPSPDTWTPMRRGVLGLRTELHASAQALERVEQATRRHHEGHALAAAELAEVQLAAFQRTLNEQFGVAEGLRREKGVMEGRVGRMEVEMEVVVREKEEEVKRVGELARARIEDAKQSIKEQVERSEALQRRSIELEKSNASLEAQVDSLQSNRASMKTAAEQTRSQLEALQQKLHEHTTTLETERSTNTELQRANASLATQIRALKEDVARLTTDAEDLGQALAAKDAERREVVAVSHKANVAVERRNAALEASVKGLEERLQVATAAMEAVTHEKRDLREQLVTTGEQNTELKRHLAEKENHLSKVSSELRALKEKFSSDALGIGALSLKLYAESQQVLDLTQQLNAQGNKTAKLLHDAEQKCIVLLQESQVKLDTEQAKTSNARAELRRMQEQMTSREEEQKLYQQNMDNAITVLRRDHDEIRASFRAQMDEVMNSLQDKAVEARINWSQQMKDNAAAHNSELQDVKHEHEQYQNKIEAEMAAAQHALEKEQDKAVKQLQAKQDELDQLTEQVESLNNFIQKQDSVIDDLKAMHQIGHRRGASDGPKLQRHTSAPITGEEVRNKRAITRFASNQHAQKIQESHEPDSTSNAVLASMYSNDSSSHPPSPKRARPRRTSRTARDDALMQTRITKSPSKPRAPLTDVSTGRANKSPTKLVYRPSLKPISSMSPPAFRTTRRTSVSPHKPRVAATPHRQASPSRMQQQHQQHQQHQQQAMQSTEAEAEEDSQYAMDVRFLGQADTFDLGEDFEFPFSQFRSAREQRIEAAGMGDTEEDTCGRTVSEL